MKKFIVGFLVLSSFSSFACEFNRGSTVAISTGKGKVAKAVVVDVDTMENSAIISVIERDYKLVDLRKVHSLTSNPQIKAGDRVSINWDSGKVENVKVGLIIERDDKIGQYIGVSSNGSDKKSARLIDCSKLSKLKGSVLAN